MEAETIRNDVDILSSLLTKIAIGNLSTPIGKLGQLVADASNQPKSLEEVVQTYAEKSYRKKRGEQIMKDIDTGRIVVSLNLYPMFNSFILISIKGEQRLGKYWKRYVMLTYLYKTQSQLLVNL